MLDESQQLDFIREVTDALREEPNEIVEELFADYEEEDKSPYPDILSAVLISHQWRLGIPSCDLRQVVVSPLIALMKDQVDALERKGVAVTLINSTVGRGETEKRLKGMADGAYKLVYVAPERFRNSAFRSALAKTRLSMVAIDEAHCISQWGHDFRPDYLDLGGFIGGLGEVRVMALTARDTGAVESYERFCYTLDLKEKWICRR